MKKLLRGQTAISLVILSILGNCTGKKTEIAWDKNHQVIGSQSSPRAVDLNEDGILDIIMGAGKNEYQYSEMGILAFDGRTGELLWQQEASDQVFGSATFYDITGDSVKDVIIGGRSRQLKALNGKTGDVIWTYQYQYEEDPILQYTNCNFYNSVLVPDRNGDGLPELLTQNGGNPKAEPYVEEGRNPGVLMLFDIKTGEILSADTMPDGKESYMSPLCLIHPNNPEPNIIFGTGGETFSGNLYVAKLSDLIKRKLSNAEVIASEEGHGFIAPPVLADITRDGYLDIIAISHGSTVFAIDGRNFNLIWQQQVNNTECSTSFAVGHFTKDDIPDFFTSVSKGVWPNSTKALQIMLDGKDGKIAYLDSMGCTGFSSPVVYDLNRDGIDEIIISINEFDCSNGFVNVTSNDIESKLITIDFSKKSVYTIEQLKNFKNLFSTPWIGDIDRDGYLDIVHCQYYNPTTNLVAFLGMRVKRISTHIRMKDPPVWGAYMGSNGDGIFISKP